MIKSMTGFGRGESNTEIGHFTVEVRSVNNKTCNVAVKLPETLSFLESQISAYVKSRTSRGRINVSVAFDRNGPGEGKRLVLDRQLAKEYYEQLEGMKEHLSLTDPIGLTTIAALPGVISIEETETNIEEMWPAIRSGLVMAVDQLVEVRGNEGAALSEDILGRLETMSQLVDQISARSPEVVEKYRERLGRRISNLSSEQLAMDESRIAMEVAIKAERCDVTEEIVRLRSHVCQIRDSLENSEGPVGRHLDFVLQEINREVNTIASKAGGTHISADCISLKDETEKIREQVQNIE